LLDASDRSEWWHWWEYHRELYLDLDGSLTRLHPRTPAGAEGAMLLDGRRSGLSVELVYGRLVPTILTALEELDGDPRFTRQALLALGRIGEAPGTVEDAPRVLPALRARLADSRLAVTEAAAIAMGALASPESVVHLRDLLLDSPAGRELVGRQRVPVRMRALAAYGLAVSGGLEVSPAVRRYAVHALADVLHSDVGRYPDVQAAGVIALGLIPTGGLAARGGDASELPPGAGIDSQITHLLGLLRDRRQPTMIRTHVPTALARLLAVEPEGTRGLREVVLTELLEVIAPRTAERIGLRRSAILAVGEIADAGDAPLDREARKRLTVALRSGDVPSRHFALIALARVGGRPGADESLTGAEEIERVLVRELARGKSRSKPWAGLALGVLGHQLRGIGTNLEKATVDALHHALDTAGNPLDAAALALGSGLLLDNRARGLVLERLEETRDPATRAHVALALGLLRDRRSAMFLAEVMDEALHKPGLMEAAALARVLVADRGLVEDLVQRLDHCSCPTSTLGVCRGLAWAGDHRAVVPLLALLEDEALSPGTRANAVEALGRVADRSVIPWDVRISAGLNYLDAPTSLTDPSGFGILDTW